MDDLNLLRFPVSSRVVVPVLRTVIFRLVAECNSEIEQHSLESYGKRQHQVCWISAVHRGIESSLAW